MATGVEKVAPLSVERANTRPWTGSKTVALASQTILILPKESTVICGLNDSPLIVMNVCEMVAPPSMVRVKKRPCDAPPFVLTKLMLPESTAIRALGPPSTVGVICLGAENVLPPSVERMNFTLESPLELEKRYRILMFPVKSTLICSGVEGKGPVLEVVRFCGAENVAPPLVLRLKKTSLLPGVKSAQVTLMLPAESTAIRGRVEFPVLLEMFAGTEKVVPPSVERLKKISKL